MADRERKGTDWNAHHIFPVELQDHEVFTVLRSRKPGWDHNDPDLNGFALPTDEAAAKRSGGLPVHQMSGSRDVRGHPVYNQNVKQKLDALKPYLDDPVELRKQVLKLRDSLVADMVKRGMTVQF